MRLLLTVSALLVSCSSSATTPQTNPDKPRTSAPATDVNPETATITDGTLTVCVEPHPHFVESADDATSWSGYEIDVVNEVADRLGQNLTIIEITSPTIWSEPSRQVCDIAAGRILINNQRRQQAIFSTPYFTVDQAIVRSVDSSSSFLSLEDMEGERIGVVAGSAGQRITTARVRNPTLRTFASPGELLAATQTGQIELAVIDEFELGDLPDDLYIAGLLQSNEEYGLAFGRQNRALRQAVNDVLAELDADGTSEEIYTNWLSPNER